MSSTRLPGKVLMPLLDRPILQWVIEAAWQAESLAGVVVATSLEDSDDAIAAFCMEHGAACFRGSLTDVAGRFMGALEQEGWDAFVRLSADSPLLDWRLIDVAVRRFATGDADVVTNVFPRSYPSGQSVEVVGYAPFRQAYAGFSLPEEFEHVTTFFYTHASDWRIINIKAEEDQFTTSLLAIDTAEDFERIEKIVREM